MKFPKCPINCIRIRIAIRRFDHFYSWYCVKFESDGISRAVFYLNEHQFPCHWYFRENGDRTVSVSFTGISKRDSFACVLCTRDKPSHFIGSQIFYNFCAFQVMSLYHLYFSPFPFLFHNIIIGVRSVFGDRFFSSFVLFVHFIWPAPLNHWEICFRTNKAIRSEWGGGAHTIKIKFIWMQKQKQMCLYTLIFIYLFCKSSPQNSRGESILLSLMLLCVYVRCNIAGKKKLSCMKIGMK